MGTHPKLDTGDAALRDYQLTAGAIGYRTARASAASGTADD
jgi:hypothetical protein